MGTKVLKASSRESSWKGVHEEPAIVLNFGVF